MRLRRRLIRVPAINLELLVQRRFLDGGSLSPCRGTGEGAGRGVEEGAGAKGRRACEDGLHFHKQ